jgi:hypothetical protein
MYVCALVVFGGLSAEGKFDLKAYERSLKKNIPWSLTGSAQDLRSDAKHHLQMILRAFVLLRPDAPWEEQVVPTLGLITQGMAGLKAYLAESGNERKRPWVADSIGYILNSYIPEVQSLLASTDATTLSKDLGELLDKKRQLLKEFSERIERERQELVPDANRNA